MIFFFFLSVFSTRNLVPNFKNAVYSHRRFLSSWYVNRSGIFFFLILCVGFLIIRKNGQMSAITISVIFICSNRLLVKSFIIKKCLSVNLNKNHCTSHTGVLFFIVPFLTELSSKSFFVSNGIGINLISLYTLPL